MNNGNPIGKVVQVAGPAVDCQFPEGQIPLIYTAIRITSEGFDVPAAIDIICEVEQHIGEGRVRTIAGKVVQVAGPAVDCQFPEGQIPLIYTAIRITSEGFDVPAAIDIICEVEQHIGEGRGDIEALAGD